MTVTTGLVAFAVVVAVAYLWSLPGELPEGCPYSRFHRWRDEWQLAGRIWLHRHDEPQQERETIAQHQSQVAVHRLRSKEEVSAFLDAVADPTTL